MAPGAVQVADVKMRRRALKPLVVVVRVDGQAAIKGLGRILPLSMIEVEGGLFKPELRFLTAQIDRPGVVRGRFFQAVGLEVGVRPLKNERCVFRLGGDQSVEIPERGLPFFPGRSLGGKGAVPADNLLGRAGGDGPVEIGGVLDREGQAACLLRCAAREPTSSPARPAGHGRCARARGLPVRGIHTGKGLLVLPAHRFGGRRIEQLGGFSKPAIRAGQGALAGLPRRRVQAADATPPGSRSHHRLLRPKP